MVDLTTALAQIAQKAQLASEKSSAFRGELYGPSGGGKSVIAAMIMRNLIDIRDGSRILSIDTSEGYVSWRNHPGLSDGIIVLPFESLESLNAIAEGIAKKIPPFDKVKGVIFDEGSKMAEQDAIGVNRARQIGAYGEKMKASANIIAEGPDYMIALERWREMLFKIFANRDLHVIVTAHQAEKKDRNGNIIGVSPMFSPKINAATKEYLHLVANLVGTIKPDLNNPGGKPIYTRTAQVHPTMMVDAKCRLNIQSTSVNADDLPTIIHDWLVQGGSAEHADDKARPDEPTNETLESGITGKMQQQITVDESQMSLDDLGLTELES